MVTGEKLTIVSRLDGAITDEVSAEELVINI